MADNKEEKEDDLLDYYRTNISESEKKAFREQIWKIRHPNQQERKKLWPDDVEPTKKSLRGIATEIIYEWTEGNMWYRCYMLEVHAFIGIKYVLDFEGTTNHNIQGVFGLKDNKVEANLNPFEYEMLCFVERDVTEEHTLVVKGYWESCKIHPIILANAIAIEMNKTKEDYDNILACGINEYSDCGSIRKTLFKEEVLLVDGSFYPSNDSLYVNGDQSDKTEEEYLMWRRVSDFWHSMPLIFSNSLNLKECVHPSFVKQGDVDNAWFIAVLASIALKPEIIGNLFITKDSGNPNDNTIKTDLIFGLIRMKMFINGIWREMFIDDFLPCKPYGRPVYCNTPNAIDQLWPSMIEKCYAKIYKCYENLTGADPHTANPCFAFTDLTGCPSEVIDITKLKENEIDDLYLKLLKWGENREVLACALCNEYETNDDSTIESFGLESGHAYSLLDARSNLDVKLVCLREPFGYGGWNGDWCTKSSMWKDSQVKEHFGLKDMENNGTFWMSWDEFLKYFTSIDVCYVGTHDNPIITGSVGVDIGFDQKQDDLVIPEVELIVPKNTVVNWIGMHQQDIRLPAANKYIDMSLFIYKQTDNGGRIPYAYVNSQSERQYFEILGNRSDHNENLLETGAYYMIPFTTANKWSEDQGPTRAFAVTIHGTSATGENYQNIQHIEFKTSIKDGYNQRSDINKILLDFVMIFGEQTMWKQLDRRMLKMGNITLFGCKNCTKDTEYTLKLHCTDSNNTENARGYTDVTKQQSFVLKPNQSQLCAVQVTKDPTVASSPIYKYGLSTKKI